MFESRLCGVGRVGVFLFATLAGCSGTPSNATFDPPRTTQSFAISVATATPKPTATPTPKATTTPTPKTTATPTPKPTATPTPKPTTTPTPPAVTAVPADSLVATIGVVTHIDYTTSGYKYLTSADPAPNGDSVVSSLKTLGVRHIRDGASGIGTNAAICPAFKQIIGEGIDVDLVMLPSDTASTFSNASSCLGSGLHAYEGPNELDGSDKTFATDDVTAMSNLSGARGKSFPSSVALFAPSLENGCASYEAEANVNNDEVDKFFDDNNAHVYFGGYYPENNGTGTVQCGIGRYGSEATSIKSAIIPATTKSFVVTETGYPDDCCGFSDSGSVPADVKAKYTLRTLLVHYHAGAKFTYFYELVSEEQSYGLTDQYLNPKPAYTALENFINIMKDPGGTKTSALRYSASANLASTAQLLFQKQDGSYWLVIWQPVESWDPTTNKEVPVSTISGTLTFATAQSAFTLYAFNSATGAVVTATAPGSTSVTLPVGDTPEILQIGTTKNPPVLATPQPAVF